MKISRVLNTNAVLSTNSDNEEIVLLGSGLGFKHKPGDSVELDKVEKQFILKNKEEQSQFKQLIESIPNEYIMVAENIISFAISYYQMDLNESIHISLADHIYNSVGNAKQGLFLPNLLLQDLKQLYHNEYCVGIKGIELINEMCGCQLPEDEAGYIAMHMINAQFHVKNLSISHMIKFTKKINNMILTELDITPDESSLSYYRYITHLRFFAYRIVQNKHYHDNA